MLRYVLILVMVIGLLLTFNFIGQQFVSSQPVYQVGETVADFETADADGKPVRFSDYQGKVVLMNFFADWCYPCRAEAPYLEKEVWQKYRERGLQVIGMNAEKGERGVKEFRQMYGLTYPLWLRPTKEAWKKQQPPMLPWNILVNRSGVVVYSGSGFDPETMNEQLAKLLRQ